MPISASERLRRFRQQFSGNDSVLILINADPDAIASAMAVSRLLWHKVGSTAIAHINVINRPDNLTMIRLLGVKLSHLEEIDPTAYSRVVMVDSQPQHSPEFLRFTPQVIIDHHPDTGAKAPFLDIRPKYGATASIMTEYLRTAKIKPSVRLATGLFHAIKSDTANFQRQTMMEDVRAFQYLFKHANPHLARKIEQAEIQFDYLKYFKNALSSMRVRNNRVYVHLGTVINPDVCVSIADFYMRVNSVTWSIISGIYQRKLIIILRNDGIRKNAGKVANMGFGQIGSAGGHKSMARAEIALAELKETVDHRDERKLLSWLIRCVERRA
ncbi:MAG: phosphoesterase [Deltaproteobacteria bacterium SG8_13]|nr:MAG: phosphoesterase [Deltaproteobacteria bacterium SG8_13]